MNIELPNYCAPATFRVQREGKEGHDHVWNKREHDEYDGSWVEWKCECGAKATAEVFT